MTSGMDPTQFAIQIERASGVALVRCRGRLVAGVRESFYTDVRQLIPDSKRIVLDLTDLTQIDSMGLGTLVRLYVSAKSAGADLELINIGKRIRQLLGVTGLLEAFAIIGDGGIRIP
jgi:anti-sigma B factor antagonist